MPWGETTSMQERVRFWRDYQRGIFRFKEHCEVYGISRKTGYKLVKRILEVGLDGVVWDRARAPRNSPHRST
jgi:putative transposase